MKTNDLPKEEAVDSRSFILDRCSVFIDVRRDRAAPW
jgi:hypothetical protein